MDNLEVIAGLEYAKAAERISREAHLKMQSVLTRMPRGGQMEGAKLQIRLDQAEQSCRAYAQIWQDLFERANGGNLTRENVDFIVAHVMDVAAAQKANLFRGPDVPRLASAAEEAGMRMDGVVGSIRRDLEIRIRTQHAFPAGNPAMTGKPQVNITISHAANVNFGSQVGTINSTLTVISERGPKDQEIANVLKAWTEAVLGNGEFKETQKRESLDVTEELAKQAEAKPESRSLGKIKALIAGMHALVGANDDLSVLWHQYAPHVKQFFHIS